MNKVLLSISVLTLLLLQACGGDNSNSDDADDTTPDAFYFTDAYGQGLGVWVVSNTFEVSGIDAETGISIDGGEYSINGGDWITADSTISNGQNITVRVFSSDDLYTSTTAILNIGGVEDTFTVRTTSLTLNASANFKSLNFSWQEVSGASYYRLWYQPSADEAFVQFGRDFDADTTATRVEIPTHTFNWFGAQFKLEACLADECFTTQSIGVAGERNHTVGYFKAANTEEFDNFGVVTISGDGNTLAVAATGEDGNSSIDGDLGNNTAPAAGAVYIYTKENMDWRFQTYLKASNPEAGDRFGTAIALSGDGKTLVVGAPNEDSSAVSVDGVENDNSAEASGAVYVYQRVGDIWLQQSYLKAADASAGDLFGTSLAISTYGGTIAVGAPASGANTGAAYVFVESSESWQQQAKLTAPNAEAGDRFGAALSITADGDELLVGAPHEASNSIGVNGTMDDNNSPYAGAAFLFARTVDAWAFSHYLKASNTGQNQLLGTAVSISADGSRIALGAPGEAGNAYGVNGDQSNTAYPAAGAVYVFDTIETGDWMQRAYVKASDGDTGDGFGSVITLSANGKLLAVGAPGEASANTAVDSNDSDDSAPDAGAAYVFSQETLEWLQVAYVKAPNTEAGDRFASHIGLDASGNNLAIGAPSEDSWSTGIASNKLNNLAQDAGAVYLF